MAVSPPGWTHFSALMPTKRPLVSLTTATTLNTAGGVTYTSDQVFGGLILRDCNGAGRTDVLPTAALLLAALKSNGRIPPVGVTVFLVIRNTTGGAFTITVNAGTGGTMSGTNTIAQNNSKEFMIVFTDTRDGNAAYTAYSLGTSVF
jgi:hypothetical protein